MGIFDKLTDKREKKSYTDIKMYFFAIAQLQRVQYPEQFDDIDEQSYRGDIVGIFAAYLDTKPKQKCVIFSYGDDMLSPQRYCSPREVRENFLPLCEEAYKHYREFVKSKMNNAVNATTVRNLAEEVCLRHGIIPDAARVNAISMDINVMTDIIDATFEMFRFV